MDSVLAEVRNILDEANEGAKVIALEVDTISISKPREVAIAA